MGKLHIHLLQGSLYEVFLNIEVAKHKAVSDCNSLKQMDGRVSRSGSIRVEIFHALLMRRDLDDETSVWMSSLVMLVEIPLSTQRPEIVFLPGSKSVKVKVSFAIRSSNSCLIAWFDCSIKGKLTAVE